MPRGLTKGEARPYNPHLAMKRAFVIVLLLLAGGGVGRAVMLCARSLCAMSPVRCCCHRTDDREPVRLARSMACENSQGTPARLWGEAEGHSCCLLSSGSAGMPGEVFSKSPTPFLHEKGAMRSTGIGPDDPSPPARWCASSESVFPVTSPIYLRVAVLRI